MIIKGIFRRYKKWNPVHPTYGAFWGMGFGIGCGVGWGPGFGPEVIGYVGSGCGIGFNVGITLTGVGIGLPANWLLTIPHNAIMMTKNGAIDLFSGSSNLVFPTFTASGGNTVLHDLAAFQRQASAKFINKGSEFQKIVGGLFRPPGKD